MITKFFSNSVVLKVVSLVYLVIMVFVTYKVMEAYTDVEFPFFTFNNIHKIYLTFIFVWGILFFLSGGANVPSGQQVSIFCLSIIGLVFSFLHHCWGIWIVLGFCVGSFFLVGWAGIVLEKIKIPS